MWPGVRASRSTITRRLQAAGIHARRPLKKPKLTLRHRLLRLRWARLHIGWTAAQWKAVCWTDESAFRLSSSAGGFVWRRAGEVLHEDCVTPTVKWGDGHIMVWGLVSGSGLRHLRRCTQNVNGAYYRSLFSPVLRVLPRAAGGCRLVWMHDNAPCPRAHCTHDLITRKHRFQKMELAPAIPRPQSHRKYVGSGEAHPS